MLDRLIGGEQCLNFAFLRQNWALAVIRAMLLTSTTSRRNGVAGSRLGILESFHPSHEEAAPLTNELPVHVFQESFAAPGRRLQAAIIGSGMIAAVHRRAVLLAGAELVGVLGSRPERSEQAARRWGLPAAFTDLADLAG